MVPAVSDRIPRVPPYSGFLLLTIILLVRDYHPLRCPFPETSNFLWLVYRGPTTPNLPQQIRFGLFPFRSPLLGKSIFLSFPPGNEMFQFPGLAPQLLAVARLHLAGLPHSEMHGSSPVCRSPCLFAAYHVFLRL